MTRRFFGLSALALLTACSGAGVSSTDLQGKVAAEIAQVVINREQLAPRIFPLSVDPDRLDTSISTVRERVAARHARAFEVIELHDLRRFYASRDGQAVVALAYAEEGDRKKPELDAEQLARVELSFRDPLIARSISILREILRGAFKTEFAFE